MAHYMLQAAYTPEAWKALVKNPQDRLAALRPVVEKLGGKLKEGWMCFGDYDTVSILEMPDNVSAAALAMAAGAGGAVKAIKTTPLLSTQEALDAGKKASGAGYKPPA